METQFCLARGALSFKFLKVSPVTKNDVLKRKRATMNPAISKLWD
jgi:hypothetical protein